MASGTCTGSFESKQELLAENCPRHKNYAAGDYLSGGGIIILSGRGWNQNSKKSSQCENHFTAPNTILIFCQRQTNNIVYCRKY